MNTKFRKLLSVMLSMFVFVGVITTPVLATEAEPVDETITEETEVVAEEEVQEEVTEPTEEIATIEEEAFEEVPAEDIAVTVEEEPAIKKASKEELEVFDEEATEIDLTGDDEVIYDIMAEGTTPTINAGKTVTDTDGDGIYELALTVKATADTSSSASVTKSNVVMVIDVSGSMGTDNMIYSEYTYDPATYNANNYYHSRQQGGNTNSYRVYYRNGAWRTSNNNNGTIYNGTVYLYETRLSATKRAANAVVDALLAYNVNDDNITDIFEITVVKFANRTATGSYNGTSTIIQDSTNATAIKNAINALNAGGGTNWQAALEQAKTEADYFKTETPNENTSVIFLTDGFPSYYGNDAGTGRDDNGTNVQTSYNNARAAARSIVSNGYTLYNIFAYGSDTTRRNGHTGFEYLQALANWAYGTGNTDNYNATDVTRKYCFNAKSTADLVAAFNTIINHITNSVGYAGVNITDGVSLGATSTSVAVNGSAKEESMRYSVMDAAGKLSYTVQFSESGAATFTIYNADESTTTLTDNEAEVVTTTINGTTITSQVYSVTVGSGDGAKTYKMSPATVDADTGMVKWDLAGLGILESGYTYTVAFDVWAKQLGYDIAADLNNGIYSSVDAALDAYDVTDATERQHIKDAIVQNSDGSYSVYTNYEQSIEYYPATSQEDDNGNITWTYGDKQTKDLPHPDPIPLKGSKLPLEKLWESGLSEEEYLELLWKDGIVDGESNEYKITLNVWKAETKNDLETMVNTGITDQNKPYISEDLGWDAAEEDYIFEKSVAVAPGVMVNIKEAEFLGFDMSDTSRIKTFVNDEGDATTYYVIEDGHYYYVTEEGSDLHFELETVIYHPMVVDGELYNVSFADDGSVEAMDPMYAVTATNTLKGGLNIHKIVSTTKITVDNGKLVGVTEPVDDDGIETVEDEFTFEIKIWKVDDAGVKSAVWTYDDQINTAGPATISGSIGYRVFSKPSLDEDGETIVYGEQLRGAILTEDSPYASLANGIYATIANNETTITLTMPANGEIRLVNLPAGTQYTVKEIEDPTHKYTYAATSSAVKETEEEVDPLDGEISVNNEVSGKIAGNTAAVETYYNWAANFYVYHSSDNTIEKISFADTRVKGEYDEEKNEYTYTFNIVDEVKDVVETTGASISDFLYGGYYKVYAGAIATDAQINGTAAEGVIEYGEDNWGTDKAGAKPYNYQYILDSAMKAWTYAQAYDVNGFEMTPDVNGVYYLKEVPNGYLRPYLHYTYNTSTKVVQAMWLISDVDDANYQETGFFVEDDTDKAKVVTTLTVKTLNGASTVKLSPEQVFKTKGVKKGYLTYINASNKNPYNYLVANKTYVTTQYWITPDGLTVEGVTTRTISIGTKKITGTDKLTATDEDGLSVVTKKE